jgi:hypothetical protein
LAAWQWCFGVSGNTLVAANTLLGGLAAFTWTTAFALPLWKGHEKEQYHSFSSTVKSILLSGFIGATVAENYRYVLAHNMVYAILPLVLYISYTATAFEGPIKRVLCLAALMGLLTDLLLLAHNSSIAFVPPVVAILIMCPLQTRQTRLLAATVFCILSVGPWLVIRATFDQLHSHPMGFGHGHYSAFQYASQLLSSLAYMLAPISVELGFMLLLAVIWLIGTQLAMGNMADPVQMAVRCYLTLSVGATLCLFIIFNVTWIYDSLGSMGGRYILFLLLVVVSAALILPWQRKSGEKLEKAKANPSHDSDKLSDASKQRYILHNVAAVLILGCILSITSYRTEKWLFWSDDYQSLFDPSRWEDPAFAPMDVTISPDYVHGPPVPSAGRLLVSPPNYPWILTSDGGGAADPWRVGNQSR